MQLPIIPIFASPTWQQSYNNHDSKKSEYIDHLEKYVANNINKDGHGHLNTFVTNVTLHLDPVFEDLVKGLILIGDELKSSYNLMPSLNIGLSQMWATIGDTNSIVMPHYETGKLFYGVYYLNTPPDTGNIVLGRDNGDRSYHEKIAYTEANIFNTETFKSTMPEGDIFIYPSYLSTSITQNLSKDDKRIVIHFTYQIT